MQTAFDPAVYWPGKVQSPRMARIDIRVRFDLWQDYTVWVPPEQRSDLWFGNAVPVDRQVSVRMTVDGKLACQNDLTEFGMVHMSYNIDDEIESNHILTVQFVGINDLAVRNDHDHFVCGMFEIQSVQLQGEEIINLLDNTFFGNDQSIDLCFSTPAHRFLVENISSIWPKQFDYILEHSMNDGRK